jgi:glycine/D-amino acid oxidase-like deaminating enzyme
MPGQRCLWIQQALLAETEGDAPKLQDHLNTDICIVGGGFTGLWTAIRLKQLEPSASVAILEADICGGAASGRNGGFALSWWPKVETLIERVGVEEAFRLAKSSESAIGEISDFCEKEGIDAHLTQKGWLWTATSEAQQSSWVGALRVCAAHDEHPFRELEPEEIAARTGSNVHRGGVIEGSGATVHPGFLVRGLRRVAMSRGVQVFERSPMMDLDRSTGTVTTPLGSMHSGVVILALNVWSVRIRELRRAIVPLGSDIVATAPMAHALAESGWSGGEGISDSRMMIHYYRTTRDGRIAFGRGGGALGVAGWMGNTFDYSARLERALASDLRRLVPAARGVSITHAWAGGVDRSPDGLPFFGRLRSKTLILYGAGFSGNGVVPTYLGAKILASTALGQKDQWSETRLNQGVPARFPPEPARSAGAFLVRTAVERKESREDDGRTVDALTRRIAKLAPSGYAKMTDEGKR